VNVPAAQPWTNTGINVTAGQAVTITATGKIYAGSLAFDPYDTPDGQSKVSTDGYTCVGGSGMGGKFLAPGLPCWSLVGRIGQSGTIFEVGSSKSFTANSSGELYLGVNDNYLGDNSGSWTANISMAGNVPSAESLSLSINPTTVPVNERATASGFVRNSSGRPVSSTQVVLYSSTDNYSAPWTTLTTTQDGSFSFLFSAPGSAGLMTVKAELAASPQVTANASLNVTTGVSQTAELIVTRYWLTVPIDSVTIWLAKSTATSPPFHSIPSNPNAKCTTLTFNNQTANGNNPTANASFTVNVTVLNQSSRNLTPPTLVVLPTPGKDASGLTPRWAAKVTSDVAHIAPGQTATLTYQVTASWATFTAPDQLTQSLEHIGPDNAGYAAEVLTDLKVISSDTAGTVSVIGGVLSTLTDALNLLQTHFIMSVNYQLTLEGRGYSVSYSQLAWGSMRVTVYAPPQEIAAFSVYALKKFSELGIGGPISIACLLPGCPNQFIADWENANTVCRGYGQSSNACLMASAHWDDAWYDSVLAGGDIQCQFNGTGVFSSCSQQFGCQSIGPGNATGATSQSRTNKQTQHAVHVPDVVIVQVVSNGLFNNSVLKTREILVTAQNGSVTLAGTVSSQMERDTAERIAKSARGVQQVNNRLAISPAAGSSGTSKPPAGTPRGNIRTIDFQNFSYASNCFGDNGLSQVIHVSKGQANTQDEEFWADKPAYGDLKGDGLEEAVVVLSCHPSGMSPNVVSSEVFIFGMSETGPKVLAKLASSYWKGERVSAAKVGNHELAVEFLETGNGPRACPEWIVTSNFRWNGNRFVNAGETRRKNSCFQ